MDTSKPPVEYQLLAAPLQGYTDSAFRCAHAAVIGGVDEYFIPFARLEKSALRKRDVRELSPDRNPPNAVPQILAATPEETRTLCQMIAALGHRRIDLNFGCPFPPVARHGYGCGVLPDAERASAILQALEEFPEIRFSLKMRLGLHSEDEWRRLLPALNAAPLILVTLHPRTGDQQYSGPLAVNVFDEFRSQCRHPVAWNGELKTTGDVARLRSRFPALPAVMIGRGLLADPLLPLEIRGHHLDRPALLRAFLREYVNRLEEGEQPLDKLKAFWEYFLPEAPASLRKKLFKSRTLPDALAFAAEALASADH